MSVMSLCRLVPLYNFEEFYPDVRMEYYRVLSETKKGVWIHIWEGKKKWVSLTGKKRFAYPDEESAVKSFIARRERSNKIMKVMMARNVKFIEHVTKEYLTGTELTTKHKSI